MQYCNSLLKFIVDAMISVQDDPDYSYYVCELIGKPWEVGKDGCIQVDNIKTVVKKGDWVIKGA